VGLTAHGNSKPLHLKSLTHTKTIGQEEILNEVQKHLTATAVDVSAILSLADVPLTQEEASTLIQKGLSLSTEQTAGAVRELQSWGIVDQLLDGELVMHDAFRLVARQRRMQLDDDRLLQAREALIPILMRPHAGPARARLLFTLLPAVGKTDALIEIASGNSELLHELGMVVDIEAMITEATTSPELPHPLESWAIIQFVRFAVQEALDVATFAGPDGSRTTSVCKNTCATSPVALASEAQRRRRAVKQMADLQRRRPCARDLFFLVLITGITHGFQ